MKIFFSKKQYKTLVKLIYLGDWLANSIRDQSDRDEEMEKVEQYIYSFAENFGMEHLFDKSTGGSIFPTRAFEEDLSEYIDEYEDENFWEELAHRLAGRDFIEHFGKDDVVGMELAERIEKEDPFIKKYDDEFYEYGIQRLRIVTDPEQDSA